MPHRSAIQRGLDKFDGSPTKLAAAMEGGVMRQHVEHWLKSNRVPERSGARFAEVTGIHLWELYPTDWHRIFPMLVGTKGAPKVPVDAKGKDANSDHAKAASKIPREKPADRRDQPTRDRKADRSTDRRSVDKPSNRKGR
jgi:hypothetical protein